MTHHATIRRRTLAWAGILLILTLATEITDGVARSDAATPGKPVSTSSRGALSRAPTLARLAVWVPAQRMAEFEAVYQQKLAPILQHHGLVASAERGRATPDSVFTRLFELTRPAEVEARRQALVSDPAWKQAVQELGATFRTSQSDTLMFEFGLYAALAGPGKVVRSGPGKVVRAGRGQGRWRTYDVTDGLARGVMSSILQDRAGHLWFGTENGGVSRYDGTTWTTFTTKDGLVHCHRNVEVFG